MLSSLTIVVNGEIIQDKKHPVVTIESYRDFLLRITDNEPEVIKNIINHREHKMPKIIYSKPQGNKIRVFAVGDEGRLVLNSLLVNLLKKGYVKINNKEYKIKSYDGRYLVDIKHDLPLLPFTNGIVNTFTTITPICVFNKHNRKIFQAITSKHLNDGESIGALSGERREAYMKDIATYANENIKFLMKSMLSEVLPNKTKDDFPFIDRIEINWLDINVIMSHYHSEEEKMPMITGKFTSNFVLPKFVGYKIGKGFGELSMKTLGGF